MALALKAARYIRTMTQHSATPWSKVWQNLHAIWSSKETEAVWFMVIHDLIPTNDRLAKIQRSATNQCAHSGRPDTLIHRLTECSEGTDIWRWTRSRIAIILHTDSHYITLEWTVRPSFHFCPLQRQGQFCGTSPSWCITVYNTGIEFRPPTTLTSCDVPDGKYITRHVGGKKLGITWIYYSLRHTPPGGTALHLASGTSSPSTIPGRKPLTTLTFSH